MTGLRGGSRTGAHRRLPPLNKHTTVPRPGKPPAKSSWEAGGTGRSPLAGAPICTAASAWIARSPALSWSVQNPAAAVGKAPWQTGTEVIGQNSSGTAHARATVRRLAFMVSPARRAAVSDRWADPTRPRCEPGSDPHCPPARPGFRAHPPCRCDDGGRWSVAKSFCRGLRALRRTGIIWCRRNPPPDTRAEFHDRRQRRMA